MNKKTLAKEELVGLHVKIKDCDDPSWIGKSGLILDETKNTFLLKIEKQERMIAKKIATFEFEYEGKKITIKGSKITYRPEDRIKKAR